MVCNKLLWHLGLIIDDRALKDWMLMIKLLHTDVSELVIVSSWNLSLHFSPRRILSQHFRLVFRELASLRLRCKLRSTLVIAVAVRTQSLLLHRLLVALRREQMLVRALVLIGAFAVREHLG